MSKAHQIFDQNIKKIFETIEEINKNPQYLSETEKEYFITALNVLDSMGLISLIYSDGTILVEEI